VCGAARTSAWQNRYEHPLRANGGARPKRIRHDTAGTIRFLKYWGSTQLVAINPKGGAITVFDYRPGREREATKWIETRQGKWNLYFAVNEVKKGLTKRAKKEDVRPSFCS
jgi:hypothetical protein